MQHVLDIVRMIYLTCIAVVVPAAPPRVTDKRLYYQRQHRERERATPKITAGMAGMARDRNNEGGASPTAFSTG